MLTSKWSWLLAMVAVLLMAPMAYSADLTNRQIENYINTLEEFNEREAELTLFADNDSYSSEDIAEGPPKILEMLEEAKGHPDYSKFVTMVKSHGFQNEYVWAEVADRVSAAVMYFMLDIEREQIQLQIAEARKEIDQVSGLTAAQKEQMLAFATEGMQLLSNWMSDVPEADLKAVEPYMPRLLAAMEVKDD